MENMETYEDLEHISLALIAVFSGQVFGEVWALIGQLPGVSLLVLVFYRFQLEVEDWESDIIQRNGWTRKKSHPAMRAS